MLTARGAWLLGAAAVLALAGALFGVAELDAMAAAAAVAVGVSLGWVRLHRWDLTAMRTVRPTRVALGGEVVAELRVTNRAGRRSPVLAACDRFGASGEGRAFLLAPLEPGEGLASTYRLQTGCRGVFDVGPLVVTLGDPLGLARKERVVAPASRLCVHPPVEVIRPPLAAWGMDRPAATGSLMLGPSGEEFFAVREYRSGDDLRRVHWASTARLDRLMIRQDETLWRGQCSVVVDLRAGGDGPGALEAGLSAAASVADAALAAGIPVQLVTTAGVDTASGGSPLQRARILDELAAAEVHPFAPLAELVRPGQVDHGGAVVFVTGNHASAADLSAASRLAPAGAVTVVLVGDGPARAGAPSGGPVVTIRPGERFGAAWERQVTGRHMIGQA
ncbi:MAG: DUF58 domain-containing protein [Acidimicrobiales bacterium]